MMRDTGIVPLRRQPLGAENLQRQAPVLIIPDSRAADAATTLFPHYIVLAPTSAEIASHDWSGLRERYCVVWAPRTDLGERFFKAVGHEAVRCAAAMIRRVDIPAGLPESWALGEPLPRGMTKDDLLRGVTNSTEGFADEDEIERLSRLDSLSYERARQGVSKQLSIRLSKLDELVEEARLKRESEPTAAEVEEASEPWPYPVDTAALLTDIEKIFQRHVFMTEPQRVAVALWALATHVFEAFPVFPRLCLTSPLPESGKTTTIDVLTPLVARPESSISVSAAALAHTTDQVKPTWLLDEYDTFAPGHSELTAILNSGHKRGGVRRRMYNGEMRSFHTFSPAAIALIGRLTHALETRCIVIKLKRKPMSERLERFQGEGLIDIHRRAARFALDNATTLARVEPAMPETIGNRAADNWRPLLAIADGAGGTWPHRARWAAEMLAIQQADDPQATGVLLLKDVRRVLGTRPRITTKALVIELRSLDGGLWQEWRDSKGLTEIRLAELLAPFEVRPTTIHTGKRRGGKVPKAKGYRAADFAAAFDSYLGPISKR
jgi:hypothetical protein